MTEPQECVGDMCLLKAEEAEMSSANADVDVDADGVLHASVAKEDKPKAPTKSKHKKSGKNVNSKWIQQLHTEQEMNSLISNNEAVVIEFVTSWCGACKGIEPMFEELAENHNESIQSAKVMCDKNRETKKLATTYGVSSYPVFIVFENGRQTSKWNGADRGKLEKTFERHSNGGGRGRAKGGRKKR